MATTKGDLATLPNQLIRKFAVIKYTTMEIIANSVLGSINESLSNELVQKRHPVIATNRNIEKQKITKGLHYTAAIGLLVDNYLNEFGPVAGSKINNVKTDKIVCTETASGLNITAKKPLILTNEKMQKGLEDAGISQVLASHIVEIANRAFPLIY